MKLSEYLDRYLAARDLAKSSTYQLKLSVGQFTRWCGRDPEISEIDDYMLNRWLNELDTTGVSKRRIRGQRGNLLSLWRAAYEERLTDRKPERVKKIKVPPTIPVAWTVGEVASLLAACDKLEGRFYGGRMSKRLFFRAAVLVAWDTGLRCGDLLSVRRDALKPDGQLSIVQGKTGGVLHCQLSPEAMEACKLLWSPVDVELLPFPLVREQFYYHFRQLAQLAGLEGTSKKIRKSAATAVEIQAPGSAKQFLGHKTTGLAEKHYLDASLLQRHRPQPPRLGSA